MKFRISTKKLKKNNLQKQPLRPYFWDMQPENEAHKYFRHKWKHIIESVLCAGRCPVNRRQPKLQSLSTGHTMTVTLSARWHRRREDCPAMVQRNGRDNTLRPDIALTSFPASMRVSTSGNSTVSGRIVRPSTVGTRRLLRIVLLCRKAYRGTGYGTRLRDQVAYEHVRAQVVRRRGAGESCPTRTGRSLAITTCSGPADLYHGQTVVRSNSDAKIVSVSALSSVMSVVISRM